MIIWGSKAKARQIGSGTFFCPGCREEAPYSHLKVFRYFTLYFIPLFPTSTLGQYVKCGRCGRELPDAVLACTREEIIMAIEPWTCPRCNNRNPMFEERCVACGVTPGKPPPIPGSLPPPIPAAPSNAPPIIPRTAPPPKRRGPVAKALIAVSCLAAVCVIGFMGLRFYQFVEYASRHHGPTGSGELYAATGEIGPHGKPASGNSAEAFSLATKMALAMTILRDEQFTQSTEISLMDEHDTFRVYCDLRPGQCVFLIHVPELRRFDADAQRLMGNLAWKTAQEVLRTGKTIQQPIKLALGIRGNIAYDRVILGHYSPNPGKADVTTPAVEEGFGCERRLVDWFAPQGTNSVPAMEAERGKEVL